MSERSVIVRLQAEVGQFIANLNRARRATEEVGTAADQASRTQDQAAGRSETASRREAAAARTRADAQDKVGKAMLGFGAVTATALGAATKAAMDWESAWAGVTKTVDGTPEQMDELEESLRGLAKTLPATHEEIAGVAEAAGQLGVKREDVLAFTRTMIDLSETTNLSADEAATAIAQIANVMGTTGEDIDNFGAALVALGNAGASTEKEIVMMAQRISGAGKLVGASESDILALSNAMASVGIEAQLGGGVMSRVMQRMYADVKTGGEGLEGLAKVAGVSSKEFATAFETDPVRAVDAIIKGLNGVKESGGNVMATMSDLGIKGTEETSVLLRLAGAGDLLTESLTLGDAAWESNSALAEEAAKRYETTEAKVQIAWNNIKDAAIDAGAVVLPLLAGVAEGAAGLAQAFGDLPTPVQGALTGIAGIAGVAALATGGIIMTGKAVRETTDALRVLVPGLSRAEGGLRGVGKAAGGAMAIAGVAVVMAKIAEADYMDDIDTGMGHVADVLADIASNSPDAQAALDGLFKDRDGGDLIRTVDDLESAINRTFNRDAGQKFNDWGESLVASIPVIGIEGSSHMLAQSFERIDKGMADLVSGGNATEAEATFKRIREAAEAQGVGVDELATKFPQYADALAAASAEAKLAAVESDGVAGAIEGAGAAADGAVPMTEDMAKALEEVGVAADGTVADLAKFTAALFAAGLLQLSTRDGARNYEAALDGLSESIKENGKSLDITTEKGRNNQAALDGIASSGIALIQSMAKNGESQEAIQGKLQGTYTDLVKAGERFDLTAGEADTLARSILGVPEGVSIESWMSGEAKRIAGETKTAVDNIPTSKTVTVYGNIDPSFRNAAEEAYRLGKIKSVPGANVNVSAGGVEDMGIAGGYTGGSISDIMGGITGLASGGKIPGTPPTNRFVDNVLAMVGDDLVKLRSAEWIIQEPAAKYYGDDLMSGINQMKIPREAVAASMLGLSGGQATHGTEGRVGREYTSTSYQHAGNTSSVTHEANFNGPIIVKDVDEMVAKIETKRRDAMTMARLTQNTVRSQ